VRSPLSGPRWGAVLPAGAAADCTSPPTWGHAAPPHSRKTAHLLQASFSKEHSTLRLPTPIQAFGSTSSRPSQDYPMRLAVSWGCGSILKFSGLVSGLDSSPSSQASVLCEPSCTYTHGRSAAQCAVQQRPVASPVRHPAPTPTAGRPHRHRHHHHHHHHHHYPHKLTNPQRSRGQTRTTRGASDWPRRATGVPRVLACVLNTRGLLQLGLRLHSEICRSGLDSSPSSFSPLPPPPSSLPFRSPPFLYLRCPCVEKSRCPCAASAAQCSSGP
jgi:hypothetical protein